ncbi:hypothetical protein [Undibacterium sp. Ji49W]|uniref:hypothetical protein n=1 Tax=Undibacterium sp. Ji49W TaxID=3413040 RepID=UPI003BF127BE
MQTNKISPRLLAMLSLVLYFICLVTPAYHPVIGYAEAGVYYGWAALLLGPIGLFGGHFSWLANPLLWFSWSKFESKNYNAALGASILAIMMALTFLLNGTIPVGSSGSYKYEVLFGYYLWLGSVVLAGFAAGTSRKRSQSAPNLTAEETPSDEAARRSSL